MSTVLEDEKTKANSGNAYKMKAGLLDDPGMKLETEMVKSEINLLASAIRSTHISESDTFTFNPFPTESGKGYEHSISKIELRVLRRVQKEEMTSLSSTARVLGPRKY